MPNRFWWEEAGQATEIWVGSVQYGAGADDVDKLDVLGRVGDAMLVLYDIPCC